MYRKNACKEENQHFLLEITSATNQSFNTTAEKKSDFGKRAVWLYFVIFITSGAMSKSPLLSFLPFCILQIIPAWGAERGNKSK